MNPRPYPRSSPRACAAWYAPGAVVVALSAAMTLAACGPRDETPLAGGAPGTTPTVASTAVAPVAPAIDPVLRASGQPVPLSSGPVVALADPAPQYRSAPAPAPAAQPKPAASNRIGSIASVEPIRSRPQGSGAGAVIGGVLGAVVGNQFGHGVGRAAMTGAGVVGGAVAGNNVERNYKEGVVGYRVSIRLDNGNTRTFERTQVGNLHVGDRVRLDANSFHPA
jgi:outer membrane lipoprotein SlyB